MNEELFTKRTVNGNTWIPPLGKVDASLMLVISHPVKDDVKEGRLLAGATGWEIKNALETSRISEDDLYITTMVKYGIGENASKPTSTQIKECSETLAAEIALVKPKLIMTMGAEPFKAVMQTNENMTSSVGEIVDCPHGKLLPNYSPGLVVSQDPTMRPVFREIFDLAYRYLNGTLVYTPYEYFVVKDTATSEFLVNHYLNQLASDPNLVLDIGYDGEWKGKKFLDDEIIYTFQFSLEEHKGIILDLFDGVNAPNLEMLRAWRPLLEHPRIRRMGWNIRVDDKRLRHVGFNIPDETLYCDGMKLMGFIDSRWPKGLETGIKKFTNYKPYYNALNKIKKDGGLKDWEMSDVKFINPAVFFDYCGGDAVAHRTACLNAMKHFEDKFAKPIVDYYKETYLPLTNYFLDLEFEGQYIDIAVMEDITQRYTVKYDELLGQMIEIVKPLGFNTAAKEAAKIAGLDISKMHDDFNPRSYIDKQILLYDIMRFEPPYYSKAPKLPKPRAWWKKQKPNVQAQYKPSTNGKSVSTIKFELQEKIELHPDDVDLRTKHSIISTLLALNRVGVFATKFFNKKGTEFISDEEEYDEDDIPLKQSYWAALYKDLKIHPDYFECLNNFRASSKPNVQNMASKVLSNIPDIFVPGYSSMDKAQKKAVVHLIPRNPREIYGSGHPDWRIAEIDVAGADLAIAAFLSQDPDYINDLLRGGFHLTKAREYFKNPNITKDHYREYVSGKAVSFRAAYSSSLESAAIPMQAEIYAESGVYLSADELSYALGTWKRYKKYMDYRDRCVKQVTELGYIENPMGIKYHFEKTEDFRILAGWSNESLAFPIASTLATFLWDVTVAMRSYLKKNHLWMNYVKPVNSIHDASIWNIHKDLLKDKFFPEFCKYYFTKHCKIPTGDNLGMEMSVGPYWKAKTEDFHGETQWNFQTKQWDWKN